MFRACICGLAALLGSWLPAHGESGVLVWKAQPFHDDATANAVTYSDVTTVGPLTQFSSAGKNLSFTKGQFFRSIAFPEKPMVQFTEETDYLEMQRSYQEYSAFAKQYGKAEPLLASRLERMAEILKGFKDGKVFFEGRWMPRAEYGNLVKLNEEAVVATKKASTKEEDNKRKVILVGILTFVIFFLVSLILRKWKLAAIIFLIPLVAAGWLTYREEGYGWVERISAHFELPSDWKPFVQKYLDKFNPPK